MKHALPRVPSRGKGLGAGEIQEEELKGRGSSTIKNSSHCRYVCFETNVTDANVELEYLDNQAGFYALLLQGTDFYDTDTLAALLSPGSKCLQYLQQLSIDYMAKDGDLEEDDQETRHVDQGPPDLKLDKSSDSSMPVIF